MAGWPARMSKPSAAKGAGARPQYHIEDLEDWSRGSAGGQRG